MGKGVSKGDLQAAALLEQDPEPPAIAEGSSGLTTGGADVLQIEDSGDALDIDLDDPFQAQMLDISQPIVADEHMLKCLKQQVHYSCIACPSSAPYAHCHRCRSPSIPNAIKYGNVPDVFLQCAVHLSIHEHYV